MSWINCLFAIVENKQRSDSMRALPVQILALRVLAAILPRGKLHEAQIVQILDRFFSLVGHLALMCQLDGSPYIDKDLLQKIRNGKETRVASTAPHSSTIIEESVGLLRTLYTIPEWAAKMNDYMCLKLSLVNEIVVEIPMLQMQLPIERDNYVGKEAKVRNREILNCGDC